MYVIHDVISGLTAPVFEAANDRAACRLFKNSLQKEIDYYDYQLYHVGTRTHEGFDFTFCEPRLVPNVYTHNGKTIDDDLKVEDFIV